METTVTPTTDQRAELLADLDTLTLISRYGEACRQTMMPTQPQAATKAGALFELISERVNAARPAALSTDPDRADYIAGLRALADLLEQHPDLELPYDGRSAAINVMVHDDQRERIAAWARAMPGAKTKRASTNGAYFYLQGQLAGLKLAVIADRDEVCERVVVGTHEVVEEAPDPDAVAALPTVTRTRVEEIVEWRCHPVLGDAGEAAAR